MPINKVYLADCMDIMKNMEDKSVELCIVDPPYGIGEDGSKTQSRRRSSAVWKNPKESEYKNGGWDNAKPDESYFTELFRISQNQIIWGANYYPEYLTGSMGWIAWYKKRHNPNCDFSDCEFAYTSFKRASKFFDFPWVGWGAVNAKEARIHPTQKPVALYKWLLQNYAKPHDKIFDSHVGSGSSRIACYDLGFDFEGCELDADYWQGQEDRFKTHINQQSLFDTQEIQGLIYDQH